MLVQDDTLYWYLNPASHKKSGSDPCFFMLKFYLSNYGYARHFKFLKDSKIILPNEAIAARYHEVVAPWYEKIKGGIFENQHLMRLRDWLLPMLMNGQVTVSKLE